MNDRKELDALNVWSTGAADSKIDILTPHKATVIFLIQEYIKLKSKLTEQLLPFLPKYRKKFSLFLLKLIQFPDMTYKDLHDHLISTNYRLHEEHLKAFENFMSSLRNSGIEVFYELQHQMDKLMSETSSSNNSVSTFGIVGLYIRRTIVTLDKMSFAELMKLYKNVCLYYEKSQRAVELNPMNAGLRIEVEDIVNENIDRKREKREFGRWSRRQTELFVAQQCTYLQNNETRALTPVQLQERLNEIIKDNPLYSQALFLNYMNSLRVRDYISTVDNLHRAFDRNAVKTLSPSETKGFQYLSLNLAILHAQFNHTKEALASLRESIMLAQECGDRVCLQLAQSWLCLLDNNQIQLREKNVSNPTEMSLIHSVSLGFQFIVKVASSSGYTPSKLFELLVKSDVLNCQHSMMDLMANCIAQRAAVWTLYGKNEIASLCSQMLLNSNLKTLGQTYNGEAICHSLCCLALWLSLQGEFILCAVVLQHAKNRFPRDPLAKVWMTTEHYVTITQAIHAGNWQEASHECCKLYSLNKVLSILQRAALNIARGNLRMAHDLLQSLLSQPELTIDPLTKVRAMILLAATLTFPNNFSPQVITILIRASTYAKEKHFDYEVALIETNFAQIQLTMGMPQQAYKTIQNALETILANGGIYDRAKTIFLFVKCNITAAQSVSEKVQKMGECLSILDEAVQYFIKLEAYTKVKDIYCYIAEFYNEVQMINERNKFAFKFRQIEEQFPTSFEFVDAFF